MKAKTLGSCILLLAVAACQQIESTARAAVSFSVTPSTVSNTYSGFITLQVAGLTNGETVVVQKFLDLNTNGIINAGDLLVQQFNMTDGQAGMVIGGIVNSNVPGDTDSTAQQITAQLNFQNGDFIQTIATRYLYKVSSPSASFQPLTNLFTVTSFPYAQNLTGNVVSNGTSTTLPNAIVLLFGPPRPGDQGPGTPQWGAVADNSGSYTIPAPPGNYMPLAFKGNYAVNAAASPVLTLVNGATLATNLTLTSATSSISGTVVDANIPSLGLPGVMVPAMSADGLLAVSFTDTNGSFTVPVPAGQWDLQCDNMPLIVHGYVGLQDGTNVSAGATGITLPVPQATALFYGTVRDSSSNALAGIDVYANDNNNRYQSDCYSDANGKYFVGALGLTNDPWQVGVSSDSSPANYIFSQPAFNQNGGTNLSVGTAVKAGFTALTATNYISGWLKDTSANPISGVGIWASATINGVAYNLGGVSTDTNGSYSVNVGKGTWTLGVSTCSGCGNGLPGNYLAPANQSVVITNNNGAANFTALPAANHITGHVQQANNNPIGHVGVWAFATINGVDYNQYVDTDASGNYSFNVANGSWRVGIRCSGGSDSLDSLLGSGTYQCPTPQTNNIANNNAVVNFTIQPAVSLQITTTTLPPGTVGTFYSQSLGVSGGQPPFTWWLPGGTISLPPGQSGNMSFSTNGTISGTPGTPGNYSFWVGVYDSASPANTVTQMVSLTINPSGPDVVSYYVMKLEAFLQVDSASFVLNTNFGPFNAYLGLVQSAPGVVTQANVTLPTSSVKALPPGSSGLELQTQESFPNQASIDAAYPPGNYTFGLDTVHDGPRFPVLSNPPAAYPNPPHVSNFAAAQSINPLSPFTLQWDPISGATTNDSLWVFVTETGGNVVFSTPKPSTDRLAALSGTATSVVIPTNTFQPGHAYWGWITYFRTTSVNLTAYPGAAGATVVAAATTFPLALPSASLPVLSQPTRISATQFGFLLSGATGQNYTLLFATNVSRPLSNWTTVLITNLTSSQVFIQDNQATNKQRFYRVRLGL